MKKNEVEIQNEGLCRALLNYKEAFFTALLCYFLIYGFELTHFTLSIDEEFTDNFVQTLSLGRWGHALLRHYILPEPYIPFFTTALSLIILSISAATAACYLKLERFQALAFVIMISALPQMAYQIEFSNQSDTIAISVLLSVFSMLYINKSNKYNSFLFIMLTVFSLSIYQSIFLYSASLLCVKLVIDTVKNKTSFILAIKVMARFCILVLIALIINSLLTRYLAYHFQVPSSSYLTSMIGWGNKDYHEVLKIVMKFIFDNLTFNTFLGLNSFPFVLFFIFSIISLSVYRKEDSFLMIFLCLSSLLSVFILNIILGAWLPPRAMTQMPVIFAGLFTALMIASRVKWLGLIIAAAFLIVGSAASNKLFYSDYMARKSDDNFSYQMIDKIYNKYPSFDMNITPVYFYGSTVPFNSWRVPNTDVFGSSFYEWDGGNNSRIYAYLRTANIANLKTPDIAQVKMSSEYAKSMPVWPNSDSISMNNGVLIIKIGPNLSPYNK